MKTKLIIAVLCIAPLLDSCKSRENLASAKKDVIELKNDWTNSQEYLTLTMNEMRDASKGINDGIHNLKKGNRNENSEFDKSAAKLLVEAEKLHIQINQKMDELNDLTHNWATHSKDLNKLIDALVRGEISLSEANDKIASLKTFREEFNPKIQSINEFLGSKQEALRRIQNEK